MSLFGSSGIRGVVGEDFTIELAVSIGAAVGDGNDELVLGRDTRTSGDMIANALVSGATSTGCDVHDAGMASTPTLARAAAIYDCGLMVTASHNPGPYNGVKLWNPDGSAFDSAQMSDIEMLITTQRFDRKDWKEVGKGHRHEGAIESHIASILRSVPTSSAKVVLDCGNGATSTISPYVLRRMGCDVTTLNCQPDGFFPGRTPEPTEDQLSDLKEAVLRKGADLGIAHDGDGDRMVAVDDRGRFVDGDRLLALFTSEMAADGVVAPMDASMVLNDIAGNVIRCKVGDVYVAEELKRSGFPFGGEPSGTYIFPEETYCPDGVFAAALLAKMAAERPLSKMLDDLPSYPVHRESFKFEAKKKAGILSTLESSMRSLECDQLLTLDGFRAEYPDGWFLIRPSGTEPKIRLTIEARNKDELERLVLVARTVLGRCMA